jgi:hypothetical protein
LLTLEAVAQRHPAVVLLGEQEERLVDLAEVAHARRPARRLARFTQRGQQQPDQHANDGDDDEQFDEREPRRMPPPALGSHVIMV